MKTDTEAFPLLGKWKLVKAVHNGNEISEPAQEVEFLPDGTCIHLVSGLKHNHIHRFTGTYLFIYPDHFSTVTTGGKGATQQFIVYGDRAESHANGRISYLIRIIETEFTEPVVDAWSA